MPVLYRTFIEEEKMGTTVEIWPLESCEAEMSRGLRFNYPEDSCLHEAYPNPFGGMVTLYDGGDEIRWGEVLLADGIAFREVTWTVQNGGEAMGQLVVYGHVVSDKFKKDGYDAVQVTLVHEREMQDAEEAVEQAYAEHLQRIGLSEETANTTARLTMVVFLSENGWTINDPVVDD
jgi:hypothetical protein